MRVVLFVLGLGAFGWGVWLFVDFALPFGPHTVAALGWLLGAPIAHDAILAPVVAVLGWLLTRLATPAWRTPIQVGAVLTAMLWLLAFPLLWRDFGAPPSPGLHDADTGGGLLHALGLVWATVLVAGTVRWLATRRAAAEPASDVEQRSAMEHRSVAEQGSVTEQGGAPATDDSA